MYTSKKYLLPFSLIVCLFFLWGFAHNLNPILIPHLKRACQLSDVQSALIDSSFFIGYFIMALPAGALMKKYGYKTGIIIGLLLFAFGALMFYPAAETRVYSYFLAALFIIASGLTFLETAANPYVTILGTNENATQRLNFAQSFNGLAATIAPLLGGLFILSDHTLSQAEISNMSAEQSAVYLASEAKLVQTPYVVIAIIVLLVAALITFIRLPEMKEAEDNATGKKDQGLLRETNLILGVTAQFFYVGAQVCVSSFFIRFANHTAGIAEKSAAFYLSIALFAFMTGRFIGTYLMKYVAPYRLLFLYSTINIILLLMAVNMNGKPAIYCLIGVEFFMSIMFPTIFSLSIQGLKEKTKIGSSLLIMAIAGGALFPVIMGFVSDRTNIQVSYSVPLVCFIVVGWFAVRTTSRDSFTASIAHS